MAIYTLEFNLCKKLFSLLIVKISELQTIIIKSSCVPALLLYRVTPKIPKPTNL